MLAPLSVAAVAVVLATPGPAVTLAITVRDGEGGVSRATLRCRGERAEAGGFLTGSPQRLCRTARRLAGFLASAPDPDRACTERYGGPQTARILGRIGARPVDRRFHRRDGCGTADWERAEALLGAP